MLRRPAPYLLAAGLCVTACSGNETKTAHATIAVDPARLEFDSAPMVLAHKTLALLNESTSTLHVSALALLHDERESFRLTSQAPLDVAGGARVEIGVDYLPLSPGVDHADLVITSDADNAPERVVSLTGEALSDGADAGTPPDGGSTPDAGTTDPGTPPGCELQIAADVEAASTSDVVTDAALVAHQGGYVLGYWTDKRDLHVRTLDASGAPQGAEQVVFHGTSTSRYPLEYLAGASDGSGVVFFVSEQSTFNEKVQMIDLHAAPVATQVDLLSAGSSSNPGGVGSLAATASAGGVLGLWKAKIPNAPSEVRSLQTGGTQPFALRDTHLPCASPQVCTDDLRRNASGHTAVAVGQQVAVAWHGSDGTVAPISGALLAADGSAVPGSRKQLSTGGAKNVLPVLVNTSAGLAVAWMQDGASRSAALALLDGSLGSLAGDLVLGTMGPANVTAGSLAAAPSGNLAVTMWTRFDSSGAPQGFSLGGVDRASRRVLAVQDVARTSLDRYAHVLLASGGGSVLAVWEENAGGAKHFRAAKVQCR